MHSERYKRVLSEMHKDAGWGSSKDIPRLAIETIAEYNVTSLLDFGSGKGLVSKALAKQFPSIAVHSYEPSETGATMPENFDMAFSKDVLEHIEPGQLEHTLYDLHKRTRKIHYHLIACHKAHHYLPDGRNAHLIVKTPDWWQRKLRALGYIIHAERVWGEIKHPAGKQSLAVCKYECVLSGMQA